jgi:2-(1,2-epoxy-1,2-dihydrophenyl)acetyl-CoA isomerase
LDFTTIRFERIGAVARIVLHRPERLNALSATMAAEIMAALDALGDARALLIAAEGRAFCSGTDLQGDGLDGAGAEKILLESYNPLMLRLAGLPIPVVTAVNGAAAGIGCSLALIGDFTVAARNAYFLLAFVNIGLVPDGGASWLLPRLVGKARTARMTMLGERITAETAEEWGMIHSCVEADALGDDALALATRLASGPTFALGQMRQVLRLAQDSDLATTLAAEAAAQRKTCDSADAAEGVSAFLEKRPAQFTGN